MDEIQCTCTKCGKLQALSEFNKRNSKLGRRSRCRTCERAALTEWRRKNYDSSKTDFRQSPHVDTPNMRLRYHLCDPVKGELVATAATKEEARAAALNYHQRRRVRIKFVEIYDERTQEVFHLTRPTKRYTRGVLRGPYAPVSPDTQVSIGRGPGKKSITKQLEDSNASSSNSSNP